MNLDKLHFLKSRININQVWCQVEEFAYTPWVPKIFSIDFEIPSLYFNRLLLSVWGL